MDGSDKGYIERIAEYLKNVDYIKTTDIPDIDLYMDQVTTFMDAHLESFKRFEDDKILTKTMINNYTKDKVLPPPVKKKYSPDHMYLLIFLYYFKSVLSIGDISEVIGPLTKQYFGSDKDEYGLSDIYEKILANEKGQITNTTKDIIRRYDAATALFDDEYLRQFAFLSSLNFDIVIRKRIMEYIIDNILKDKKDKEKDE